MSDLSFLPHDIRILLRETVTGAMCEGLVYYQAASPRWRVILQVRGDGRCEWQDVPIVWEGTKSDPS
jgi:hypothetical protein